MAIPAILPYQMPKVSNMPKNKVSWTPHPKRAALLIHDMQQYFLNAYRYGESPVTDLLANIKKLRKRCAELGIPVIFTAQPGAQTPEERGLLQDFWGPGIGPDPDEQKIVDELKPNEDDIVLTKWRYNAFRKTNLLGVLKEQGRDQLIITGIYAHIGCLMTACDAFMQDIETFFVGDAVADFSLKHHEMAITYAADRCSVTITAEQLLSQLKDDESHEHAKENSHALTKQIIREQVASLLLESPEKISDSENLIYRGLDSVRIMSLAERWRRSGREVSFVELAEDPSIENWWRLLSSSKKAPLPNTDYQ
ncbi:isochorismatase family protein [Bacillus haynesii]|uniref:isochorismatase family protein n=1 Tax=Bacillus haynesii TaxID=1925021 RepID=UPI00227EC25A|nr:isochorismatase family protein [Bacillus haynesii]MCY8007249.1 isochorismatase family protein [Bacillus haynesii]MCY8757693.1 isochorismatase family protein [Bacillus haynesii]MCY9275517.1 isochorismatase family protein [Bacillus haynesii]MEC0706369.1 isochorismatase family protein [Bacillus haynesii]MEC0736391.1 isochorismatase family protein [Bacillus haynesii]